MKAVSSLPRRTTYADYLATEQRSERRHEFIDGVIVALAGGSDDRDALHHPVRGASASRVSQLQLRSAILDRCHGPRPL
jgi:hypothetical protein